MFDEFREMADEPSIFDEVEDEFFETYSVEAGSSDNRFLGMTPGQRLFLAVMFFLIITVVGLMALMVTGKIWL